MIRELRYGIIFGVVCIAVVIAATVRGAQLKERLEARTDSLALVSAATDVLIDQLRQQAADDSTQAVADSIEKAALRRDLTAARNRSARVIIRVDSIAATIDEDTLTAGVQDFLGAQREVCKACAEERGLEKRRADKAESELSRIRPRFDSSRLLVFQLQAERDTALALVGDYQRQLDPGFFRRFFKDLPQKAACAGGGAIVAEINNGKALTGAAIALGVCLAMEAIF